MSIGLGVDVGASVIKVATADADATRSRAVPRDYDLPELLARIGTRVPHVRRAGDRVVTRRVEELFVHEVVQALRRVSGVDPTAHSGITIIAPTWWTPRARAAAREALETAGLGATTFVNGAVAAVEGFRTGGESMPATVAVLDLGAHSCSAAVVTGCQAGEARLVGEPSVVHGRGGRDLDARLLHHVLDGLRGHGLSVDRDDPDAVAAARVLLDECRLAKEALSVRPVVTVEPRMLGAASQFRLVRAEHDDVARPATQDIVQVLRECLGATELEVEAVLLVGGGAPIPIVTQQISVELGLPVLLDNDPSTLAVRGAARRAFGGATASRPPRRRGWLSRRKRADGDRRHRAVRAGVAAMYVAIALVAGVGGPDASMASPTSDSTAVSGDRGEQGNDVEP